MILDHKRLSEDLTYWQEKEPEGGAEYYNATNGQFYKKDVLKYQLLAGGLGFTKHELVYYYAPNNEWSWSSLNRIENPTKRLIKKPKAPTKKAWSGKGAPEVGDIVYLKAAGSKLSDTFPLNEWLIQDKLEVVAYISGIPVCMNERHKTVTPVYVFNLLPAKVVGQESIKKTMGEYCTNTIKANATLKLSGDDLALLSRYEEEMNRLLGYSVIPTGFFRKEIMAAAERSRKDFAEKAADAGMEEVKELLLRAFEVLAQNTNLSVGDARWAIEVLYQEGMLMFKDGE